MNETSGQEYARLRRALLEGRTSQGLVPEAEDALLEEMDRVWWAMTATEREAADRTLDDARREIALRAVEAQGSRARAILTSVLLAQASQVPPARTNEISPDRLEGFQGHRVPHVVK